MADQLQPMVTDWTRALAVVAHPDDLEFGAAGAIAAWTAEGKDVAYLLLTRGEAGIDGMPPERAAEVREAEQRASAKIVGVFEVEFLDHRDGIIEYGTELRRDIAHAIRRHRPELIVGFNHHDTFPGGKRNSPDHRHTGLALFDAVGDAGNRWIFPHPELEPWGGVKHIAIAQSPYPTHAVDITDTLDLAIASIEAHAAYLEGIGIKDIRGPFTAIANGMGERFGNRPAITLEVITR
ncbi:MULTISPECIES: PIG-L deacetylase family protein [Streptomyces]|uniref:PIG-L deacetylase family protein n=1 Tax=Streptomyces sp. JL1001 TaxID=3078227 RepID=A0AAU8KA47_9ACTN|nr:MULTISPECIES: PIG-L deacetylase family protein [unclassified Streptomyces]PJN27252.1 PIG-L domain-containing protein [Streptomyces sp. CB02613]